MIKVIKKRRKRASNAATYSVEETADRLSIGINQAYELVRTGKVKAIRIGRVWRVLKIPLDRLLEGGEAA
jgi:excisionase family DNA binding protein